MKKGGRTAFRLFFLLSGALGICLALRAWALAPLYLSPSVRDAVRVSLERVADERGWFLSDLTVRSIERDRITIIHRHHHRGTDARLCFIVPFDSSPSRLCGE